MLSPSLSIRMGATMILAATVVAGAWADTPTPERALELKPIQPGIDYDQVSGAEARRATIRAQRDSSSTAWVVRGPEGNVLRRFADTNADNVVDQWSYYKDGLEIYRDIDADFNGKADAYRWFHMGGTRWGIDKNEDGQIDQWKIISAQEVAEELVLALRSKDLDRFKLLLPSSDELKGLGLGDTVRKRIGDSVRGAPDKFRKTANTQKVITAESNYVDFGVAKPAMVPAGTDGATKDVTLYDSASVLVETVGKHEQIPLGTMVWVGNGWRLVDVPAFDGDEAPTPGGFLLSSNAASAGAGGTAREPSAEMLELMAKLQNLDQQAERMPFEQQGRLAEQRADVLQELADVTSDADLRNQWLRELADMLSAAVQSGDYSQGAKRLAELEQSLAAADADKSLVAHVAFRRILADYGLKQQDPDANLVKVQEHWLENLRDFAEKYPGTDESAEALLQLAMSQEFAGDVEEAKESYQTLVDDYAGTSPGKKAAGAIRRLGLTGRSIQLRGTGFKGETIDLTRLRGKLVLVQYWATWSEPSKTDMLVLKEMYAKHGGQGFEIVGVCLDDQPEPARKFVTEKRIPWKQVYEKGGLDGRLADEMGVTTLPLMILVDKRGAVIDNNIQLAELEDELKKSL